MSSTRKRMNSHRKTACLLALAGFGLATAIVARRGARNSPMSGRSKQWYDRLDKPRFTPPKAVFPIVWTSLYALMAWSGWRICSSAWTPACYTQPISRAFQE